MTVSLSRALGHALAEDVVANENIPSFDNIVEEIAAGKVAEKKLQSGRTMSIVTGAKIPEGADAVVQVEWTERVDETHVRILRSVPSGHNNRRVGGDIEN